jgi:hypothetical protein
MDSSEKSKNDKNAFNATQRAITAQHLKYQQHTQTNSNTHHAR